MFESLGRAKPFQPAEEPSPHGHHFAQFTKQSLGGRVLYFLVNCCIIFITDFESFQFNNKFLPYPGFSTWGSSFISSQLVFYGLIISNVGIRWWSPRSLQNKRNIAGKPWVLMQLRCGIQYITVERSEKLRNSKIYNTLLIFKSINNCFLTQRFRQRASKI